MPKKGYLQRIVLHYFIQKGFTAESHIILAEPYGDHTLSETASRDWFRLFKHKDLDFVDNDRSSATKRMKYEEFERVLYENTC